MTIDIRPATHADAEACGRIIFEAFEGIARRHGFPPDFPSVDAATGLASTLIDKPAVFGVVAERNGRVVGSNFLSETDQIRGVGPITVAPEAQNEGVGRALMQAVVERATGADGVRLLQDGFNMASIALYAGLGFQVREPVLVMSGRPDGDAPPDVEVRAMTMDDVAVCDALCLRVHSISRRGELEDAVRFLDPLVAERQGRVVAYMTAPNFWIANHGVAETEADMQALILAAATRNTEPLSFLLPTRQTGLFRWCLSAGMRAVKPMTLMSIGAYRPGHGTFMPSVFY